MNNQSREGHKGLFETENRGTGYACAQKRVTDNSVALFMIVRSGAVSAQPDSLLLLVSRVHNLERIRLAQHLLHICDDTHWGMVVALERDSVEWFV